MKSWGVFRHLVTHLCLAVCCAFLLSKGATAQTESASESATEEEKTEAVSSQELVLQQLEELRTMIEALRSEVDEIRKSVESIHRVAVRPRVAPAPASVTLNDARVMGSSEAKVAIVEFSDFQCPYCRRFYQQTFPQIKETYIDTGKLQYVFRDFPLEQIHGQAIRAAIAANCSGRQGKYWEMHHALFENQGRLGPDVFAELAQTLELDLDSFETCLEDPAQKDAVNQDLAYGESVGIRGTPHYFVGRVEGRKLVDVKRVNGAQPFPTFQSVIDALLTKKAEPEG